MKTNKKIRLATAADAVAILEIYAPFIENTVITFEYTVPTVAEFAERMACLQQKYPWLVYEDDGMIVGYAYASPFSGRAAYDWSADFSVYIKPQYHGKKIGKALYFALFEVLKAQGYYNVYGGVAMPNVKSEALHKSMGFEEVGGYKNVGYKLGKWIDVKWFQLKIQDYPAVPSKPKTIHEISGTPEFSSIIEKAESMC